MKTEGAAQIPVPGFSSWTSQEAEAEIDCIKCEELCRTHGGYF